MKATGNSPSPFCEGGCPRGLFHSLGKLILKKIMERIYIARKLWLVFLVLFTLLSLTNCAVVGKEMSFWPDAEARDWHKEGQKDYYNMTFRFGNSSFGLYPIHFYEHAVSIGPPLLPIIPVLAKPDLGMLPQLGLKI
jgi:hypothetical protein